MTRRARRDTGSAALELALTAPAFLLLVFLAVQAGLWAHGRTVALAAAREGVAQLRVLPDEQSAAAGRPVVEEHVRGFAAALGGESLLEPRVRTSWDPLAGRVAVQVSGRVVSLVPGLHLSTAQTASGTLERFGSAR